ncbi:phosphohydrolase [Burkholderia sp. MSMB0856]|uniref:HD domain-containing protein n=1 Tax=Burkholderia sp. MSMB0856 TaxID=1637869 RepID=UPI0007597858|nr:HD domain-containing protein [Burkholderia sp. MSMB0856]AOJ90552.1 phosphohydrolase [Burkholderia sp. MSMB0856]KVH32508.1 phosphohydrolase [Burkholderia sp. MSMB0856]
MGHRIAGILIPDSAIAREAAAIVRAGEPELLFRHAMRVFAFASVIGTRRGIAFDAELLYVAALFHDIGLTEGHRDSHRRYEIDGANVARAFLGGYGVAAEDAAEVWRAIALHTSFGLHPHMTPLTALLGAGIETDLFARHLDEVSCAERNEITNAWPRGPCFKELFLEALAAGTAHRPETAFGNVCADALERCDPDYRRTNFCGLVLGSKWAD